MASNVPTTLAEEGDVPQSSEAQGLLQNFWPKVNEDIRNINVNDLKTQELPLARIKKIMKLDEDVKMISAEAPVLFAKAAEIFISELSLRAWIHTEDNKRRTLQKNDVSQAVGKYDQFDFLIDIVPRDEIKPAKRDENVQRTGMMPDQVQYYFQLAQQTQQALQSQPAGASQIQGGSVQQVIQAVQQASGAHQSTNNITISQPSSATQQVIQIQGPPTPQPPATPHSILGDEIPGTQVFQQVVDSSGQVVNMPITLTQDQLQAIQAQMQGKQPGQSIVIHTQGQNDEMEQPQPLFQVQLDQDGQQHVFQTDSELEQPILIHKQER